MGNYVRNARRALGYETLAAWADHLDISARTLGDLERGKGAGTNTIAAVENALFWAPGSARDILNDGEPTQQAVEQDSQPPELSLEERLERLESNAEMWEQQAQEIREITAEIRKQARLPRKPRRAG